jgi:hypothetical protein
MNVICLRLNSPINLPLNAVNVMGVEVLKLRIQTLHVGMMPFPFGAALQAK